MRENLDASHGLFFSQRLLLALINSGLVRERRTRFVQRHAMRRGTRLELGELVAEAMQKSRPRRSSSSL